MSDYSDVIFNLVEYEVLCNLQAVDSLMRLDVGESTREFGFGLRTPHRTVSHIADVMRAWSGCVGPVIEIPSWPPYDDTETLQEIRERIVAVGDYWLTAAKSSHEQGLLGEERRLNQVFHLITHGTHHRGQLLSMISLMGHEQPFEGGDYGGWSNQPS
jgi:uncharacterized damage-inducible protein DinB